MTQEYLQLLMLKDEVSKMPQEVQDKVASFRERFLAILDEDEDCAAIAMGWVGLEKVGDSE